MTKVSLLKTTAAALVIAVISFAGCGEDNPEDVPGITIDDAALAQTAFADETSVTGGVTFTTTDAWTATVAEGIAKASGVTWLTISPDHGDAAGKYTVNITLEPNTTGEDRTATITVTSGDMSIKINVTQAAKKKDGTTPVTGVTLDKDALMLSAGQTETLTATVAPDDAGDKTVTWKSDNTDVAIVDAEGKVTAVKAGTANIVVTTTDGSKTATCIVTVNDPKITMTTTSEGEVEFRMAGIGEVVIDWGDGFAPETVTLSAPELNEYSEYVEFTASNNRYTHTFSGTSPHTIDIYGENITHLYTVSQLTALNITKNTALTYLGCGWNQLTNLDVAKNTALTFLDCNDNRLTSLDVTKNTILTYLGCGGNKLTSLDVSKNTELKRLDCYNNPLMNLDVTKNTTLTYLWCEKNQLTALDVTKNTTLTNLGCTENQLTCLDMTKNTALTELICYNNKLTSLDMTKNTALTLLGCGGNQFTKEVLDALFGSLPANTSGNNRTIFINSNPGTDGCDQSIATAKGWTVVAF